MIDSFRLLRTLPSNKIGVRNHTPKKPLGWVKIDQARKSRLWRQVKQASSQTTRRPRAASYWRSSSSLAWKTQSGTRHCMHPRKKICSTKQSVSRATKRISMSWWTGLAIGTHFRGWSRASSLFLIKALATNSTGRVHSTSRRNLSSSHPGIPSRCRSTALITGQVFLWTTLHQGQMASKVKVKTPTPFTSKVQSG